MSETLLRLPQVMKRTGLGRSSIYAGMRNNIFPKPIKLGKRAIAWTKSSIDNWIDECIKNSRSDKTKRAITPNDPDNGQFA